MLNQLTKAVDEKPAYTRCVPRRTNTVLQVVSRNTDLRFGLQYRAKLLILSFGEQRRERTENSAGMAKAVRGSNVGTEQ